MIKFWDRLKSFDEPLNHFHSFCVHTVHIVQLKGSIHPLIQSYWLLHSSPMSWDLDWTCGVGILSYVSCYIWNTYIHKKLKTLITVCVVLACCTNTPPQFCPLAAAGRETLWLNKCVTEAAAATRSGSCFNKRLRAAAQPWITVSSSTEQQGALWLLWTRTDWDINLECVKETGAGGLNVLYYI